MKYCEKAPPRFRRREISGKFSIYKSFTGLYNIQIVITMREEREAMDRTFPKTLSALRREKNISQRKAAADLGISQALLSHYENGTRVFH